MLANGRRSPKYCKYLLAIKNNDQVLIPAHKELLCMLYLNCEKSKENYTLQWKKYQSEGAFETNLVVDDRVMA